MAALEDMLRDRMSFLDLSSDPNSSATEKDFANNVLRNEFTPGVQNKGGSAKSNKVFAAYQVQLLKATQYNSAKATANQHLSSSHGTSNNNSTTGGHSSTPPNPESKTQQKKKVAADNKPTTRSEDNAGGAKKFKGKAKADPIRE